MDIRLQIVKKYWRHAIQIADKLNYSQDFFCALTVFTNKTDNNYN